MIERLLLYGIHAKAAGAAIGVELDRTVCDAAHETQAALAFVHPASARANVALHSTIVELVPIERLVRFSHGVPALLRLPSLHRAAYT